MIAETWARRLWDSLPEARRARLRSFGVGGAPARAQWMREVMNRELDRLFASLPTSELDCVEVSGGLRKTMPWRSYTSLEYPEYDLCGDVQPGRYDVVVCEQVLEHVPDLRKAVTNLKELSRPGGTVLVSTPFLVRIHGHPSDFWRFTPAGLRFLLEQGGLEVEWVHSWGNKACVRRNLGRWALYRPWRSLTNEADVPVVVWALARRPVDG